MSEFIALCDATNDVPGEKGEKMINKKWMSVCCVAVVGVCLLTGCTKYGKVANEDEVLEKVEASVVNEQYTMVSKEDKGGHPKEVVYTFKSEDRDIEFTAVATLKHATLYSDQIPYYEKTIIVNYDEAIQKYYMDRINKILVSSEYYNEDTETFVLTDESQLDETAAILEWANEIYSEESKYNKEMWMKEHPVCKIRVNMIVDGEEVTGRLMDVTGTKDSDDVSKEMIDCYEDILRRSEM